MTASFPKHWGPFVPTKGSAAFTATPIHTPPTERSNHFESPLQSQADPSSSLSDRSSSVDSSATLVDDDDSQSQKLSSTSPLKGLDRLQAPEIDSSSRGIVAVQSGQSEDAQWQWAMTDRELYHRLQNLSHYPSALPLARRRILVEMNKLLQKSGELEQDPLHIFSLPRRFDAEALRAFLQRQHDATTKRFADYAERRSQAIERAKAQGLKHSDAKRQGMEMFFGDREAAKRWMRRASVVKYVDGAWLQHLLRTTTGLTASTHGDGDGKSTTPQHAAWLKEQRRAARQSWQVMSEELGDGDLSRSHVAIYEKNMDDLARQDGESLPPKGEEREYTEWSGAAGAGGESFKSGQDSTGNDRCWRAALAQLSLSVSPNEFLPEAIGWNASFEGLPYHLLVSCRELQELDLDAYYFWLHVSIDNASTGHAAMARECIVNFVQGAKEAHGDDYADEIWARIKLGFALADFIPTTPLLNERDIDDTPKDLSRTILTNEDTLTSSKAEADDAVNAQWRTRLVEVFKSKAATAHGLHAGVKARIAGETLSHWLDPAHVEERVPCLLDALAANPVWIVPGHPNESKFVREFEWGGKMFGAMTGKEVDILRQWVATLPLAVETSDEGCIKLCSDEEVEGEYIDAITRWLSIQSTSSSRTGPPYSTASLLRPVSMADLSTPQNTISSWRAFSDIGASTLYSSVLSRPDCVRSKPDNFDELLKHLASSPSKDSPVPVSSLASSAPGNLIEVLTSLCPQASITTETELTSLLPILANTLAPLEQIVSISPSKLASPLGMAIVKILRVLHGFTESSNPLDQVKNGGDGRETGCMGTEDLENDSPGLWETLQDFASPSLNVLSLDSFKQRPTNQLALSSILLVLSSHFWEYAPLSLGVVHYLISLIAQVYCVRTLAESSYRVQRQQEGDQVDESSEACIQRIRNMVSLACSWTERAIQIGVEEEQRGSLPRGVSERRSWTHDIQWGWRLADAGVRHALGQ
ncbi:unnamed protein product [Sympodiomycopsis kandeliae]